MYWSFEHYMLSVQGSIVGNIRLRGVAISQAWTIPKIDIMLSLYTLLSAIFDLNHFIP